jgi:hypothetical protein
MIIGVKSGTGLTNAVRFPSGDSLVVFIRDTDWLILTENRQY